MTRTPIALSVQRIFNAATALLPVLEAGRRIERPLLRDEMTAAFGATDAAGAWNWKQAYEAAEVAMTLLLRRYDRAMLAQAPDAAAMLKLVARMAGLEPPQTRRDDVQQRFQQFSTPLPLGWVAAAAAQVQPDDVVLEPSAGTGTLAALAALRLDPDDKPRLAINELTATRAGLLQLAFPETPVTRHDAENISDLLPGLWPTVAILNPPFSRSAEISSAQNDTDLRHLAGRLPGPQTRRAPRRHHLQRLPPRRQRVAVCVQKGGPRPDVHFTQPIAGRLYRSRGTTYETRLTVLDKPGPDDRFPEWRAAGGNTEPAESPDQLLAAVLAATPARRTPGPLPEPRSRTPVPAAARHRRHRAGEPATRHDWGTTREIS